MNFLQTEKNNHSHKFKEELVGTEWMGIIVNTDDELFMGRCKVKVFEKFDELPDDVLPWAFPSYSSVFAKTGDDGGAGSFSYPKVGTLVRITFQNGDLYSPEYSVVQNLNKKMQSEISSSYTNSQVVVYDEDEDMKIIYTQDGGLLIWHKGSFMRIDKDKHITINHVGSPSKQTFIDGHIRIDSTTDIIEKSPMIHADSPDTRLGPSAFESAVRCESLFELLNQLAVIIDSKVPSIGPVAVPLVNSYIAKCCSTTVDIAK